MDAKISVKNREQSGSAAARRLRRDGLIPGVIYKNGEAARSVSLPAHDFEQILHHHASEQMMIQIVLDDGREESVLLKEVQHDAITGGVEHVDLQEVSMTEKLQVDVPVELVGDAVGVQQGGVLDHQLHSVEVECLPADIPEQIEVDVSELDIGDQVAVADIRTTGTAYEILTDDEMVVASVFMPRAVEEEEEDAEGEAGAEEPAEPEVINEKKDDEEEKEDG